MYIEEHFLWTNCNFYCAIKQVPIQNDIRSDSTLFESMFSLIPVTENRNEAYKLIHTEMVGNDSSLCVSASETYRVIQRWGDTAATSSLEEAMTMVDLETW